MLSKYDIGQEDAKGNPIKPNGPLFDDVIKEVPVPVLNGPEVLPKKQLLQIAEEQTVAISRIADNISRGLEWQSAQQARKMFVNERLYYTLDKMALSFKLGLLLQAATAMAFVVYILVK